MKNKNYKKVMQAMILVVLISVISGYIYFTGEDFNSLNKTLTQTSTPTGFAIYDNNPNADVVVPDMDLKNKYGYFTGHGEMRERGDNKFDVVLSSSPGIPGLVHTDQMPEAIVEIKGLDNNNQSMSINSTIDVLEEGAKDYDEIKTAVFAMDSVPIENATITLPKTAYTQYILRCEDFDQENFECVSEGYDINGWEITEIPFVDNGDTITFTVTHFTGYAGGGTNETNSANLTIWDNTDTGMFHGDQEKYVLEIVEFFANYTMLNGSAISGAGVSCVINFGDGNNSIMNFVDAYQLYEYDRTFSLSGTFGFNVSCDGSLIGYVPLNTTDNVTISSLSLPQGQGGVAPSVTIPVFNESSVNATLNINASVNYTDPEADVGTLYFNWFVNNGWVYEDIVTSVAPNANVSRQLNTGNYSGNATITIEVTPYDGTTNGTKKNSTSYFQICLTPYDNLTVRNNITLCAGTYNIQDDGSNGVIISGTNDANISCDGTRLVGAAAGYGIAIGGSDFNIIKGCIVEKYKYNIEVTISGHNNTFINNTLLSSNIFAGISISGGDQNNITNNTFYNNSYDGINIGSGSVNTLIWGNKFLGSGEGIDNSGTNTNFCLNDLYGNYYDDKITYTGVPEDDCGPTPNATIMLYDKSEQYNWSWGSTGTTTFNNLREAVYNTENNRTIRGFPESGTFWLNDTDTVRSNITLDCNGIVFDDKAAGETAITFKGENDWLVKNCTFNRYSNGIYILNSGDNNNSIMNNTFLSSTGQGIQLDVGDHNNITNNTFFNNTQEGIDVVGTGALNTFIWGNRFLGNNNDGVLDSGTGTDFCVNNIYGNYYDNNVDYGAVMQDDCGPAPNATVWLYDKSAQYNWSWGSTGTATFNNLREAVYNTENNRTIKGFPESSTFWYNDTDTVRSNITLDCNGIVFDDKAAGETAITFRGEKDWLVKNCTFNRYSNGIYIFNSGDNNNSIMNNTFLSSTGQGIQLDMGDHNNITNNTFFNNTLEGIDVVGTGALNTFIWGNRFLGLSNDGVQDSGTGTNFCVNDLYGNYYNGSVDSGGLDVDDCGPTPNATITVDKNGDIGISWGTNLSVKDIQEGVYNTWNGSSKLLQILPASGPYNGSITSFRNNIIINCSNNSLMGGGAGTGITISNRNIKIQNCTFNNFDTGISLKGSYNLIYNNTFLGNDLEAILFTTGVDSFNVIKHNNFTSNNDDAIDGNAPSATSTENNITENTFDSNTDYAITIASANMLNTSIWRNNFRNNRIGTSPYTQVNNVVKNTTFNVSNQGNYWSDYDSAAESCNDANGDGFCDFPQDNITGAGAINDSWPYSAFLDYFNSRPVITLSLKPITAYSNSTLNATANYTDAESDIGTVYFEWFRNNTLFWNTSFGSISANANISDNLTRGNFTKWTNITVQVTGFDGVYNSTPINVSINISNTAPEIRAPVLSPSTAYANNTVNATFVTWDIDGDAMTAYFDWYVNGTYRFANFTTGVNNNTNISSFLKYDNYTKWANVTVMVTLYDGVVNSTPQNLTINISNYVPESVKVAFSPETIYTNTTVNITSKVWDIDGDAMIIYYDWFVNKTHRFGNFTSGLANNTNVSSFLNHGNFTKWNNLTVQVVVYDGVSNSTPINYSANNVSNIVPEIRAQVISPSTAYANDTVNATFVTWDIDNSDGGDLLTAYFDWFVNGTYRFANFTTGVNNNTNISSFLKYTNYTKWANVTVMVTLYDGVVNSTPQNLTINISNFVPIAISPIISPHSPEITDTLNATLKVWDIDSDAMTVYIDWFVNEIRNVTNITTNVANGTNVSTYLGTGNYSGTSNVTFQYAIYDGFSNSTPINSSYVYFTNIAPSITLSLKPTTAYGNNTLNATANYTDLNDNVGTVYFNWFRNGTMFASTSFGSINPNANISDNLTSGNFSRWTNITVQATPFDGTVNGTAVNVSINISNYLPESVKVAFSPDTIYTNTTVNITSKVWDIDGDAMTIYYDWFVNKTHRFGNFTSGLANNTNVSSFLHNSNFTKWSNLTVQVVVYDGVSNSSPVNYSANNVTNIAPEIRASVLSPSTAYANDTVNATFVAMDIDNTDGGDVLTAYFDWYINNTYRIVNFTTGINNNTNISSFLRPANFSKWSNVTVMVTLYDGVVNSTPQNLTINISNYAAESVKVAFSPDTIYTNTTVNITSKVWDIDGDAMTIYYDWFVNKTHRFGNFTSGLANNTNVSSFLNHNNFTKWSNLTVQVVVYDGVSNSSPINYSANNVTNLAPYINATDIYSPNNCSTEKINGSGIPSDIDLDAQTLYFNWFVTSSANIARINYSEIINNVNNGDNTSRNLTTGKFTIGDNVTLQITAHDGADNSSSRNTTTITIRDCTPQQPDGGGEGTPPSTPPSEPTPEEPVVTPEIIIPPICESSTSCSGWGRCADKKMSRTCVRTSTDCTTSEYKEQDSCCYSDSECDSGYKCTSNKCELYQSCTDSDGSDTYTTGYVYGLSSGAEYRYGDRCADKTKVVEYICSGLSPTRDAVNCVSGCENGKCKQCIPDIVCEDWTKCEEKIVNDRSGKENKLYQKTRVCKDLNKCLGEYTDTAECCPSGIVGRATGSCNLFCEPKEECQWSSCSNGARYETCTKTNRICQTITKVTQREKCKTEEKPPEKLEDTFIRKPIENALQPTDEHIAEIIDTVKDIIPEDWKDVKITTEKVEQIVTEHTEGTLDVIETNEEEQADEVIEELKEETEIGQETSIESTHTATTIIVENTETGETEEVTAVTITFEGEETLDKNNNDITPDVQEINSEVEIEEINEEEVPQDIEDLNNILDEIGEAVIPEEVEEVKEAAEEKVPEEISGEMAEEMPVELVPEEISEEEIGQVPIEIPKEIEEEAEVPSEEEQEIIKEKPSEEAEVIIPEEETPLDKVGKAIDAIIDIFLPEKEKVKEEIEKEVPIEEKQPEKIEEEEKRVEKEKLIEEEKPEEAEDIASYVPLIEEPVTEEVKILPEEEPAEEEVKVIELPEKIEVIIPEEELEETWMDKFGKAVDVIAEKTQPEEEISEEEKTQELIKQIVEEGLKETPEKEITEEGLTIPKEEKELGKEKKGIVVKGDESAEELTKLLEEHNIKVADRLIGTTITENDVVFASSKVENDKDTKPVILGLNVGVTEGANRKSKELKIKIITGESKSELITRYRNWLYKVEIVQSGKSKKINNIKVIEFIPKHVANSATELVFVGEKPIILQDDPIIEWSVDTLKSGEKKEFSYIVKRKLTKVETVSIVSGEYEDKVEKNALPCTNVTYSETKLPVTTYKEESKQTSNAETKVKEAGYSVIMTPFNVKCTGDNIDFTINIPDKYADVNILKCTGANCEPKKKETVNELTCGNKIIRETTIEEEFANFMPINITEVSINITEFKNAVAAMKDKIEYYDEKTGLVSTTIDEEAMQPQNSMLRIIGAPLKFKFDASIISKSKPLETENIAITIPLIEPVGFENKSFALYINTGKDEQGLDTWEHIESDIDYETKLVNADIINASSYLDHNKEIEVALMGILCLNCLNATLEPVYMPKTPSRDAVILVHGLASSPAKYEEIIKDIKLTEQPFQAWTFAYPTTDEIEKNAKEFARLIEEQQDKFDRIYIAAHSLGGITTQQALYYAYQENLKQPADKPAYQFVNKVKRVVVVGSPNEGTPGIEPYKKLFQFLINAKTDTPLFNVNSNIISKLSQGLITPQIPSIDYYVIAGNKPYPFSNVFFEKVLANGEKVVVPNDGIVGVKSAQHIGDEYINNTCQNYWEVGLTHTELLANPAGRKQIEKIVAEGVLGETSINAIMGSNQYYQFHISDCSEKDMYMVVGKETDEKEVFDETGCKCGDGYCANFENSETCPSDCPKVAKPIRFGKTTVFTILILLLLIVLVVIGSAAYLPYGIYKHHVNKRKREMHFLEAEKVNLEHYIHDVSRKMHIVKVREMLISKGWNKEVIEKYIKQVEMKSLNALETYAKELIEKGIHPLKVREHLIRKGWHPTHVDKVLEVKPEHVLEQTTRQLNEYVKHRLSKGSSRTQIKEELLRRGWQETIIDKMLPVKPEDYLRDIKIYVKERLKSKANILMIRNELVKKGWKEEVIDKLLEITPKSVEKELKNYIDNALKTRRNKLLIKDDLVKKGWPVPMIENMLGLDGETSVYELGKYIKERLSKKNKKQSILELRNELIEKGWPVEIVDRYLRISDEEGIRILKAYIEIEIKEGNDISEIKKKLREKGWDKEVIESCIAFDNRKKIEQLKDYVKYELFQKHTTLEIREKLLKKQWNKNIVDELLGFNQEIGLELLINYIKTQHKKGASRIEIKKKLAEKGWDTNVVDDMFNKIK